jgi:UbiD family decarboxylase
MNVQVKPDTQLNTGKPSELRDYIAMIERDHPKEILRITDEIDPAKFEATAILANLEEKGINPMVLFERPINQLGKVSPFPLITNIYSSRRRDALALGLRTALISASNIPAARPAACRPCASPAPTRPSSR